MVISLFFNHPGSPPPLPPPSPAPPPSRTLIYTFKNFAYLPSLNCNKNFEVDRETASKIQRGILFILLPLYLRLHNMLIYCCVLLMYSISKCDATMLTSCTLCFYYINKFARLFAQQCQGPISPNRISLAQLCSCISLKHDFKK